MKRYTLLCAVGLLLSACSSDDPTQPAADEAQPDLVSEPTGQGQAPQITPPVNEKAQRELDKLIKLAELGDTNAQARIAWMYQHGEGAELNHELAFKWMKKAADKGDSTAQDNLGVYYREGIGTDENPTEAANWFKKSAMQGNAQGQGNLGQALIDGKGIEKNYYLGYVWSGIAVKSSNLSFAKHNQTQVGSALKPEQRAQADKAIADWKPGQEPAAIDLTPAKK